MRLADIVMTIPSCRYLLIDHLTGMAKATPEQKVATLSVDTIAAVAVLRSSIEAAHDVAQGSGDDAACCEVCLRLAQDSWLLLRRYGQRRSLIIVLERSAETLLEVMERFAQSGDRIVDGQAPASW